MQLQGHYFIFILALVIVVLSYFFGDKMRKWYNNDEKKTDYDLIRLYLLNHSPMYGHNKPKLWIHTKYDLNARKWLSFQSRNSHQLNQPYLFMTIQTIVNMCGNDFHICLIDDDTFAKLIPGWDHDMQIMQEPVRSHMRQQGLMTLLYYYGGMVVPDSFLCMRTLLPLYHRASPK